MAGGHGLTYLPQPQFPPSAEFGRKLQYEAGRLVEVKRQRPVRWGSLVQEKQVQKTRVCRNPNCHESTPTATKTTSFRARLRVAGQTGHDSGSINSSNSSNISISAPAMSGVTEDIRSFSCRFFMGVLLSGGMLGPMGAAGSNWPRVFSPFFPLFFPRQEEWGQTHQARFALVFFLVFSTPGGLASAA